MSRPLIRTLALLVGLALICVTLGLVDAAGHSMRTQLAVSAVAWCTLGGMLALAPVEYRLPAVIMVLVATDFECFGSLLCGFYHYRLHNLPLYVPAGHGIFYLVARRALVVPEVQSARKSIVRVVLVGSGVWVGLSLFMAEHHDVEGALWWPLLAYCLCRRRNALMYAITFVLTMALEYLGTGLGAWQWAATLPGTGLPSSNPPSACAAGYCLLDASTVRMVGLYSRLRGRQAADGAARRRVGGADYADLIPVASQVKRA